jgi:O-acetyl-ADP-ribose deacetylase (regulator of RNase III)
MAEINEIFRASIFDSTCQTLVNTVNCVGVMGRGLALEFKMRFPDMYEHYRKACERRLLRPGKLLLYKETIPWILNFPTKDQWKYPSKIEFIEAGLSKFVDTYQELKITSVAFPKLGTSSGNLDWVNVRRVMFHYLTPLKNLQIEIYHFDPNAKDNFFDKLYQKIHRFKVDDYMQLLGLKRRQAKLLHNAISSRLISTMLDLQSIDGIGEKSLKAIYDFVRSPEKRIFTASERTPTLF